MASEIASNLHDRTTTAQRMLHPRFTAFARCSKWCSTPLRLLIALLALMSVCLCAMLGISVLANLVYSVIIPALVRPGSAGPTRAFGGTGHVLVAVLAGILVIETTVYFISALGVLITQLSFVGWFRTGWRDLLLPRDKRRSSDVQQSHKKVTVLSAAADVAEQSFVALIVFCTSLSLLLAIWWRTGERAGSRSPDPEASATAPLGPPSSSSLLGAETYVKDALRIGIVLHSMAIFLGTVALLVGRALSALCRSLLSWYTNPKMGHVEAAARVRLIAVYILASPFLLFLVPLAFLLTRLYKRLLPRFGEPLYNSLALAYLHAPLFEFSDMSSSGTSAGVGGQALLFLSFGVGDSAWHNFLAGLRHYTAWYASLWFIGSLVYAASHPGVVSMLGVLGGAGCTVTGRRCAQRTFHSCKKALRASAPAATSSLKAGGSGSGVPSQSTVSTDALPDQTRPSPLTAVIVEPGSSRKAGRSGAQAGASFPTAESMEVPPPPPADATVGAAAVQADCAAAASKVAADGYCSARASAAVLPLEPKAEAAAGLDAAAGARASFGEGPVAGSREARPSRNKDRDGMVDHAAEDYLDATAFPGEDVLRAISRGGGAGGEAGGGAAGGEVSQHAEAPKRKTSTREAVMASKVARRDILVHVLSTRASSAQGTSKVLSSVPHIAHAATPPCYGTLTEKERLIKALAIADSEIDPLCAWGSILLGLTLICCIMGFIMKPALGGAMAVLTAFLMGSWCMRRPPHGKGSVLCKLLLVLVAAVYGLFTSSYSSDVGASPRVLLSPSGTWDNSTGTAGRDGSTRAYDSCSMTINGISPLDHCFLALSAYSPARIRDADVAAWFGAAGRSVVPQPMNRSDSGLQLAAYKLLAQAGVQNDTDRLLVMIRGTTTQRDVAQDALVWQEVMLFQLFSMVGPFGTWPNSVKRRFVGIVAAIEGAFGVEDSLRYTEEAVDDVRALTRSYPHLPLSVSGHSLGGGLSTLVGQRVKVPSVSFSGPGVALSAHKLRIEGELSYDLNTVFLPDHDVVPLIDEQVGTVQNIRCLRASSALECHSIARTCCELRRSCGDAYGRTMMRCPVINGVASGQ